MLPYDPLGVHPNQVICANLRFDSRESGHLRIAVLDSAHHLVKLYRHNPSFPATDLITSCDLVYCYLSGQSEGISSIGFTKSGLKKTMTATSVTRFYAFFCARKSGNFSPHFGAISILNLHSKPEEMGENPLEKIQKKIHWRRRPEIVNFCPLSWSNLF